MIRFKTGYGNKAGEGFKSGDLNNTDIEFKTGYRYVLGKRNKAG